MKRLFVWMLAMCLLLSACGGAGETTEATEEMTTEATVQYTEAATEAVPETTEFPTEVATEPTEPPVEELPDTVNPLTGETLEQASNARPMAIMINNSSSALPHHGISAADLLFETLVEGGMTRCMAMFTDPASAGPIGSVRSVRPPFVGFCQAYDALFSSASGADNVLGMVTSGGVDYLNALVYEGSYFYRNQQRLNSGYAFEHTLFIDGEDFYQLALDKEMRLTRKEGQTYGFRFDDAAAFEGEAANKIKIYFEKNGKTTTVNYDAEQGVYTLYQQGKDVIDGNTGELVPFRNILILQAEKSINPNGIHVHMETVGEGAGYCARDGKIIPITWSRATEADPYSYKTADGQDLVLGVGTSYIAVVSDGAPLEVE